MPLSSWLQGFPAVAFSTVCYGSYFVPARKHEVHDGVVFQWYQCCGLMLSGLIFALIRNDWQIEGKVSPGFYVAPEGVLSGTVFQVANMVSNFSVKIVGLGNYYTIHQVSNLGLTFFVGIFGPSIGLEATPPGDVGLATLGFIFIMLGMIPVMLMRNKVPSVATSATPSVAPTINEDALPDPGHSNNGTRAAALLAGADKVEVLQGHVSATAALDTSERCTEQGVAIFSRQISPVRQSVSRQVSSMTSDSGMGRDGIESMVLPQLRQSLRSVESFRSRMSVDGSMGMLCPDVGTPEYPTSSGAVPPVFSLQWLLGAALALLAGAGHSGMYVIILPWKTRMRKQSVSNASQIDTFFGMCVGVFLSSTLWLLVAGAWKTCRRRRLEKSVLQPALLAGIIYSCGLLSFLYGMTVLPYAVSYATGVGGGLAVSLLWSTFAFGEASTPHNRRCVVSSFLAVFVGVVLLALAT